MCAQNHVGVSVWKPIRCVKTTVTKVAKLNPSKTESEVRENAQLGLYTGCGRAVSLAGGIS